MSLFGISVLGPWGQMKKSWNDFVIPANYAARTRNRGPKRGFPPLSAGKITFRPAGSYPRRLLVRGTVLLGQGLSLGSCCPAQRGPWSVEILGLDPLIFSGLGR